MNVTLDLSGAPTPGTLQGAVSHLALMPFEQKSLWCLCWRQAACPSPPTLACLLIPWAGIIIILSTIPPPSQMEKRPQGDQEEGSKALGLPWAVGSSGRRAAMSYLMLAL